MSSYLDDYYGGMPTLLGAQRAVDLFLQVARRMGWSIPTDKVEIGQRLKVLGIVYDTRTRRCSIPDKKRRAVVTMIRALLVRGDGSRKEYERLAGNLCYLSSVDPGLMTRLCLIYQAASSDRPDHLRIKQTQDHSALV